MASSLVTAFRQQFPRGSMLSEVMTIHDGLFVVRVTIGVENTTLSQALAANNSLELAEDIACNRALERLALNPKVTDGNPEKVTPLRRESAAPLSLAASSPLPTEATRPAAPFREQPFREQPSNNGTATMPDTETDADTDPVHQPLTATPPLLTPEPELASQDTLSQGTSDKNPHPVLSLAIPPSSTKPEPADLNNQFQADSPADFSGKLDFGHAATDPIDLSDIIAQTDVELQRLGWDVNQGREFLEKTYGKRSRHDLTDEELLEFLLYLESQPMPSA